MPLMPRVKTPPANGPLSVQAIRSYCRIDSHDEDALLAALLMAAVQRVEGYTWRCLMPTEFELVLPAFPFGQFIDVPMPPLQQVASVKYYDENNTLRTFASNQYIVDACEHRGRIVLADGSAWPGTKIRPDAVTVTYTAGYSDSDAVPGPIKVAIFKLVEHWYANRGDMSTTSGKVSSGVDALLNQYITGAH